MIKNCPGCGREYYDGSKYCSDCGAELLELSTKCRKCGAIIKDHAKFCSSCGTAIALERRLCKNCGEQLSEGDVFCSKCGMSVRESKNSVRGVLSFNGKETKKETTIVDEADANTQLLTKKTYNIIKRYAPITVVVIIFATILSIVAATMFSKYFFNNMFGSGAYTGFDVAFEVFNPEFNGTPPHGYGSLAIFFAFLFTIGLILMNCFSAIISVVQPVLYYKGLLSKKTQKQSEKRIVLTVIIDIVTPLTLGIVFFSILNNTKNFWGRTGRLFDIDSQTEIPRIIGIILLVSIVVRIVYGKVIFPLPLKREGLSAWWNLSSTDYSTESIPTPRARNNTTEIRQVVPSKVDDPIVSINSDSDDVDHRVYKKRQAEYIIDSSHFISKETNPDNEQTQRKNDLFLAQRYQNSDFGYSIYNPIMSSSISESDIYLDHLRTIDGLPLAYLRRGTIVVENLHGIKNVAVDEYQLFLKGKEFKKIYICPFASKTAKNTPQGLFLTDENDISDGNPIINQPKYHFSIKNEKEDSTSKQDQEKPTNTILPLKWHHFLVYFSLWFGSILSFFAGIALITGWIYYGNAELVYSSLEIIEVADKIYAICLFFSSVFSVFVAIQLIRLRPFAPTLLLLLYGFNGFTSFVHGWMTLPSSGTVGAEEAGSVISLFISLIFVVVFIILNKKYYDKRKTLFVNKHE
ncbi:MAG: zinc-ribbon domain-containing protein [Clostridia bacterium]|nr:zinc-ribbon domain-containing protein [Clostridia bacterium]